MRLKVIACLLLALFEVLDSLQAAEGDAQIDALEDGRLVHVALRHIVGGLYRDDRGHGLKTRPAFSDVTHDALASFSLFLLNLPRREAKKPLSVGLLVASITRISTIA